MKLTDEPYYILCEPTDLGLREYPIRVAERLAEGKTTKWTGGAFVAFQGASYKTKTAALNGCQQIKAGVAGEWSTRTILQEPELRVLAGIIHIDYLPWDDEEPGTNTETT